MKSTPYILPSIAIKLIGSGLVTVGIITVAIFTLSHSTVSAADKRDWVTEDIISDRNFTDKDSMSVNQIQSFLDRQIGSCDMWGKGKAVEFGSNQTRAQFARSRGWPGPPYVCLNKYYEVPKTTPTKGSPVNNFNKNASKPRGSKSAAWIIKDAANRYNISPKVLLAKIATESAGPLTSDKWPLESQYRYAMGSNCPDSGPGGSANCDDSYAGFSIQMYSAAGLMRSYLDNMDKPWWSLKRPGKGVNGSNYVGWNVAPTGCGGTHLNIRNKATAALYTYTPYQPNQAALNNLYGTGDRCSAYGNRNFWRVYTDWFGSTGSNEIVKVSRSLWLSPSSPTESDQLAASFVIKNDSKSTINIKEATVAMRNSDNDVVNFPHVYDISIAPGKSYTYHERRTVDAGGEYNAWIAVKLESGEWTRDWPHSTSSGITRARTLNIKEHPDVEMTRSIYHSPIGVTAADQSAASFIITNNESKSIVIPELSIAARHENGTYHDFPSVKNITLAPGSSYTYYERRVLDTPGRYTLTAQTKLDSKWVSSWPSSSSSGVVDSRVIEVAEAPNVRIERNLYVSPSPILAGQPTGASFIIKNYGDKTVTLADMHVTAKGDKGTFKDFPSVRNITLQPNQEYKYYEYQTFDALEKYTFDISIKHANITVDNWPQKDSHIVTKRILSSRLPKISLVRSLWHSPLNARVGQTKGASFVIRNDENRNVTLNTIVVSARDNNNNIVDFPYVRDLTLSPGQIYEYYEYRKFNKVGINRMWINTQLPWKNWSSNWPSSDSTKPIRSRSFTIQK